METINLQSVIGLTIQSAGIILVTALSLFMTRSIRRTALDYWSAAWVCLALSLTALSVAFRVPPLKESLFSVYLFGEYAFGYLFIAGCRNYSTGARLTGRHLYWLILGVLVAVALPQISDNFNLLFIPHAAVLASLFAIAFYALKPARLRANPGPGLRVMSVALVLLTLDFLHYVPIMAYAELTNQPDLPYLRYTSIYDLILEILLGFGTLMVVMDDVRLEVEDANRELIAARDRLEKLARMDPLTEALNRHGFYSLVKRNDPDRKGRTSGCVVVLDIDDLKPINDLLGHAVGDAAIRAVASGIRSVIRADDLLFRWGGDEFLIVMFNVAEFEVRKRINHLDNVLADTIIPDLPSPITVIVSHGTASFNDLTEIESAIERADGAMYARKEVRKKGQRRETGSLLAARD
ncbi:MAG: GGDEF domain-containing protein [Blastocatellia bacterium]|nr:GGDEF domain-containing protein [Blastocatellia bacterium]